MKERIYEEILSYVISTLKYILESTEKLAREHNCHYIGDLCKKKENSDEDHVCSKEAMDLSRGIENNVKLGMLNKTEEMKCEEVTSFFIRILEELSKNTDKPTKEQCACGKKEISAEYQLNKIKSLIFEESAKLENRINKEISDHINEKLSDRDYVNYRFLSHKFDVLDNLIYKMEWITEYNVFKKSK